MCDYSTRRSAFHFSVFIGLWAFFSLQLYARRHFLFPPKSIDVYNERVMAIVRCEAQVRTGYSEALSFSL